MAVRMKDHEPDRSSAKWALFLIAALTFGGVLVLTFIMDLPNAIAIVSLLLALVTLAFPIPWSRRERWSPRQWALAVAMVSTLILGTILRLSHSGLSTSGSITSEGGSPPAAVSCPPVGLPVGAQAPDRMVEERFKDAYRLAGGEARLGRPCNAVTYLDHGWHQNLSRNAVILTAENSPRAYVLSGPIYHGWLSIAPGHGERITGIVGYPVHEGIRLPPSGWQLELRTWDNISGSIISRDGARWYLVQDEFWTTYSQLRGPKGALGYPTGNVETGRHGDCQKFERGWLVRTDRGVRAFNAKPVAC